MMMKNGAQTPFSHNMPSQHHQQRTDYYGGYRQGHGAGFGPQGPFGNQGQLQGQQHLFTPPTTAHGLPAMNRPSTSSTHSNGSHNGSPSPVADVLSPNLSLNTSSLTGPSSGSVHSSPVSTSSLDNGLMVPPNTAVSPIGLSGAVAFEARGSVSPSQSQMKTATVHGRGRSGSVLSVGSGGASPSYELAHGYDVGMNVPRRMEGGGGYMMNGMGMGGMNGMPGMAGGMHHGYGGHSGHHGHGAMQHGAGTMGMGGGNGMNANMIGVGVGGGNNGNAMMMMMM
ncbi:hypothetical protein CPB84DRAFT_1535229 [Gymnopilus junonius]|uniref:Uncharacterized protein n=1 Tax=Gymnopilus junonius TaxID=109634 RepID=A0A9P5TJ36_GYMJU|nr:hypothetical protein CPB84DRAFT_1535229 [Gymnopilus junonius]